MKKVTMRDVAAEAHVAVSTVSQVFNNKPNVSDETRQHVLSVANKLGYSKPGGPTPSKNGTLTTLGLLTRSEPGGRSMLTNPFYSHIIVNIERECQRRNINLMYANIEVDEDGYNHTLPSMLLNEVVDGVIVVGAFLEETINDIYRRARRNIVLIDGYTPANVAFDSVLIDNIQGATLAVTHLIENGHRKIGLIGSHPNDYPSIAQRRQAYVRTLARHGIHETFIEDSNLHMPVSLAAVKRLMQCHPDLTAIFACNDDTAINAVMVGLREMGYRVPEDVSVIGFDNTVMARASDPPLTTIHVDRELLGVMGVRQLIEQVENPSRSPIKTLVATHLVQRDSVKNIVD